MNFKSELRAHMYWKIRLMMFINGSGEKLDSYKVSQDNQCELGQWIYGEGLKYQNLAAYQNLKSSHARFHEHAAEVVRHVEQGSRQRAENLMKAGSPFMEESIQIGVAFEQLTEAIQTTTL